MEISLRGGMLVVVLGVAGWGAAQTALPPGAGQAKMQAGSMKTPGPTSDVAMPRAMAFPFEALPVATNANGASRHVLLGAMLTGEPVEMHETMLLPGHMPHPAHQHRHSEFILLREGHLAFLNEGRVEKAGPGDVIFTASGKLHGMKNAGDVPAQYFVVAIGHEAGEGLMAESRMTESRVYVLEEMPVRKMANGGESRDFVRGVLPTGEVVGLHASVLPAGVAPSPMHVIEHSELIMVREGTVEFLHDGKAERLGPGGVAYVAKGTNHALKNVGEGAAKYFVLGIGGDVKP